MIFCDICVYSVDRMAAGVNERLSLHGVETHGLGLESVFNGVADPFEGLKTVHMQEKFYSEHLDCIVSLFGSVKCVHCSSLACVHIIMYVSCKLILLFLFFRKLPKSKLETLIMSQKG